VGDRLVEDALELVALLARHHRPDEAIEVRSRTTQPSSWSRAASAGSGTGSSSGTGISVASRAEVVDTAAAGAAAAADTEVVATIQAAAADIGWLLLLWPK
jgi:hypothetical protein